MAARFHGQDYSHFRHKHGDDAGAAIEMRELGQWIIAFLIIKVVWIIYLVMAFSAANVAVDQQAETTELGPFYAMPLLILLFVSVGSWLMAAIVRVLTILARSTSRSRIT